MNVTIEPWGSGVFVTLEDGSQRVIDWVSPDTSRERIVEIARRME